MKQFLFCVIFLTPLSSYALPLDGKIIIVDAGHGTIDTDRKIINGGKATNDGIPEHKLTLEFSELLKKNLETQGAKVYLTRTKSDYWRPAYNSVDDNKARAVFANSLKGNALISIHCDWHPNRDAEGITTLYSKKDSKRFGMAIHTNLIKKLAVKDRKLVNDDFTILDYANMPAVIVETGFMSHKKESRKLLDNVYQAKLSEAIAQGLVQYFKE